jgi:hypothetical protein
LDIYIFLAGRCKHLNTLLLPSNELFIIGICGLIAILYSFEGAPSDIGRYGAGRKRKVITVKRTGNRKVLNHLHT